MKKKMFTIAAFLTALVFWFFDSFIHHFLYKEPEFHIIPDDFNELWMRAVIVILIMLFGIFSDYFINRIMFKEKQLEVVYVYSAMIYASHHILNNLLNQMRLFKMEAQRSKDFDRDVIALYDNAIKEASDLMDTLTKVKDASEESIYTPVSVKDLSSTAGNSNPAD
jgi:membrane-associated HD superfamily phosphohydrolase